MPGLDARAIRKLVRGGAPSPAGQPQLAVTGAGAGVPLICVTAAGHPRRAGAASPGHRGCPGVLPGPAVRPAGAGCPGAGGRPPGAPGRPARGRQLRLRPGQRLVTLDGTEIALTGTEFDVLSCLARQAGRTVTRHRLRQAAWGRGAGPGDRTVDVYIAQLRAKLGPDHGIRTVRGIGYVLDPQTATAGPDGLHPGGQASRRSLPLRSWAQGIRPEGTAKPRERARRDPGRRACRPRAAAAGSRA